MEYCLLIVVVCLALPLPQISPKPITIYTSEPIKLEHVPAKKDPEPKTTVSPMQAFIHAFLTSKQEEKKKPEPPAPTLPPYYVLYPYSGLFAIRPMPLPAEPTPPPFFLRMKMFYNLFG